MKQLLILFLLVSGVAFGQQVKHKIVDNQIVDSQGLQQPNTERFTYSDGWRNQVIPLYDAELQYLGERYYNSAMDKVTWVVVDYTTQELAERAIRKLDALDEKVDVLSLKRILQKLVAPIIDTSEILTQQQLTDLATIYPQWRINKYYKSNEVFAKDSLLFRVIQAHTSQADWQPETTGSLYTPFRAPGEISDWVQPTGAHDAYQTGEKVNYNGKTYESLIDNNTWSPDAYPAGWKLI
jgi:hypothetical protein